jgi:hypothetical protein
LLFFAVLVVNGQGCSDAGACSVGSMGFLEQEGAETPKLNVSFEQTFGLGEKFVLIGQSTASIKYQLFKHTQIQLRAPFIFTLGNLGSTSGVGDMIFSVTQTLFAGQKQGVSILAGTRLKSNNSDFTFNGNPLPMAYQTSLGTYDILSGIFYYYKKWDFYIAYQHPFNQNNNQYLHPDGETNQQKLYYESAQLIRGDDLYLRFQRHFSLKHENTIKATILTIYRLREDQIIKNDENIYLAGSKGITINPGVTYIQKMKNSKAIEYALSFPIIDRKYRADGLTRNLVMSVKVGL